MSPSADAVVTTSPPAAAVVVGGRERRGALTGTALLVRLVLRLDRVRLPLWIGAIVALVVVSAVSVTDLYSTPEQLASYVRLMQGNPTLIAINGPGLGFDHPNRGVVLVNETSIWIALATAAMSVFMLVRHTRSEEENERVELIRSGVVGRHAPTAAALIVVAAANVAVGLLVFLAVVALGFQPTGAVAYSASFIGCGLVFAGVAALAGQVATSGRAAIGWSMAVLGAAYGVRAVGDLGDGTLSWASPLGWVHQVRAFAGVRWWVLVLSLFAAAGAVVVAAVLSERRDLGGGVLPQRLGPASAAATLTPRWGLSLRLQRGQIVGWAIGLFSLGATYGAVARDVQRMFEDNPDLEKFIAQFGGASITDSYVAYTLLLGALLVTGFAIASALRLRSEESSGRADLMLAAPLTRLGWALSHLWITVVGSAVLLAASGFGTGVGLALSLEDSSKLAPAVAASMVHLPAVLVLVGVVFALFGTSPRTAAAAWAALAAVVAIGLFGELLRLPEPVRWLSPFEHTPAMPAEAFRAVPVVLLLLVAAVLMGIGLVGLRRRDIATG